MVKTLKPAIERRLENDTSSEARTRKRIANDICRFLEMAPEAICNMPIEQERFYSACEELLRDKYYRRILLYLPLWTLEHAPATFRKTYLDAWYRLLYVKDVRENFHTGDCFELDARPRGGLERVVKCVHLTPWLIKYGYIDEQAIMCILRENEDYEILLQSFKDTYNYIRKNKLLSSVGLREFAWRTTHLPERKKQEPLYVSERRLEWLDEQDKSFELLTPSARLEGPFSDNIPALQVQLEEIAARLRPSEIAIIGGSQLKGYGTTNSDLDCWTLQELKTDELLYPGSIHATHIYFNTIWLGGRAVEYKLEDIADGITRRYTNSVKFNHPDNRRRGIERLENDLLQYRLLHKGFSRITGRTTFCLPIEMDGDCPFYCDKYRRIATMLYAKYVWL